MNKEISKLVSKTIFAVTFTQIMGPIGIPVGWMLSEYLMESLGEISEKFFEKLGEETGLSLAESNTNIFGLLKGKSNSDQQSSPDYTLARLLAKVWETRLDQLIKSRDFDDAEIKNQNNLLKKWRDKFKEAQDEKHFLTFHELFPKETFSDVDIQQKAFETITNQSEAEEKLWEDLQTTLGKWANEDEKIVFQSLKKDVRKVLIEDLQSEILVQFKDNPTFRDSFQTTFELYATEQLRNQGKTAVETNKIVKQLLELLQNQPKPATLPKYIADKSFPTHTNYFTGRGEVIDGVRKELEEHHKATLHGISGLGKTSVALEYAKRFEDSYKHIIFLRATDGNEVSEFARLAEIVDESAKGLEKDADKAVKFKTWLEENDGWLLLIDNVDKPSQVLPLFPANLRGHILSTGNADEITVLGNEVAITKMVSTNGELLLYRRAKTLSGIKDNDIELRLQNESEAEQNAVKNIVSEFVGLPLALNLAGAYIHTFKKTFAQYENLYRTSAHQLLDIQDVNDQYQNYSVALAFSLAFEAIEKPENKSSEAKQIAETAVLFLKTASFLNPEAIPLEIFIGILIKQGKLDEELLQDKMFYDKVFAKIAQFDLFEKDTDKDTVNIHRLVQKVVNNKIEADEKRKFVEIAVNVIDDLFPNPDYKNWKICNRLLRHAETALNYAETLKIETNNVTRLYHDIGYYLYYLAGFDKAIIYFQKALLKYKKTVGKKHFFYAVFLNSLAKVYHKQGRYDEAIEKLEEALQIGEKTIGKKHSDYAFLLNELGSVYLSQNKYDEAIAQFLEILAIAEKTIGKKHPHYATYLNNLADAYGGQGKYDEAIEKFEEALRIDEKTIGKEHPYYAIRLGNISKIHLAKEDYQSAEKNNLQVLKVFEGSVGKFHPYYATCLNDLASVYYSQGRFDEALPFFQDALLIFEKALPENHPYIQGTRESLENCRKAAGKESEKGKGGKVKKEKS